MKSGSDGREMSFPSGVLSCLLQSHVPALAAIPWDVAPAPSDEDENCLPDGLSETDSTRGQVQR